MIFKTVKTKNDFINETVEFSVFKFASYCEIDNVNPFY